MRFSLVDLSTKRNDVTWMQSSGYHDRPNVKGDMCFCLVLAGHVCGTLCTGAIFYPTAVDSYFPATRSTYITSSSNEQSMSLMWRASASPKENISTVFLKYGDWKGNTNCTTLKRVDSQLTAKCSNGERCASCRHARRTEWRVMRVIGYNYLHQYNRAHPFPKFKTYLSQFHSNITVLVN